MAHSLLERAFELARTGDFVGVESIAKKLKQENHLDVTAQLEAPTLRKQLADLCRASRAAVEPGAR